MTNDVNYCSKCGAPLTPGAEFCARCGAAVAAAQPADARPPLLPVSPPAASPPAPAPRPDGPNRWWIVPGVIVGLVVITWFVLAHLPLGGNGQEVKRLQPPAVETVTEAAPSPQSATIVEVSGTQGEDTAATIRRPRPARVARAAAPPVVGASERTPIPAPVPGAAPPPATPPFAPSAVSTVHRGEISGPAAQAALRGYVASTDYYHLPVDCVRIDNRGYQNVGYTLEVSDACDGGSKKLGRWRVDAKTGEIFRQRDDGRYLRP